ncbi:MAG: transketolase [Rhodocyclales bacterium]|nr:transketolase [Rhodocyclales bacterium]
MALEPLRDAMGRFFINAGVAEQNMISVAAGMTRSGIDTWAYSIAPFAYARPFEQIRNDVCLNRLPVRIVGNGGGYAYGVMGPSHHAIEDYGVLLGLQGMAVYVPAFAADVEPAIRTMALDSAPAYLRLGRCEKPAEFQVPAFQPWRLLIDGGGPVLAAVGPLAGALLKRVMVMEPSVRPALWVLSVMPNGLADIPPPLVDAVRSGRVFAVAEEHVAHGGAGQALLAALARRGVAPARFLHFHAVGYPSGRYGSQAFHRQESGIDPDSVLERLAATGSPS